MSVSHELRTPLTSIRGYAEAVLDGATDDPHAAAVVISGEARRLERLVQDLLDLARLDADRFTLDLRTVDAALSPARSSADSTPGRPRSASTSDSPPALRRPCPVAGRQRPARPGAGQPGRERRLVRLRTASRSVWRRTPAAPSCGSTTMDPAFRRTSSPGCSTGMSPPTGRARRRPGSGLGLAIVRELASAMGATVRAESPLVAGAGTRLRRGAAGAQDDRGLNPVLVPAASATPRVTSGGSSCARCRRPERHR